MDIEILWYLWLPLALFILIGILWLLGISNEIICRNPNREADEFAENGISNNFFHGSVTARRGVLVGVQLSPFNQSNIISGVPNEQPLQYSETSAASNANEYIIAPSVPNDRPPQYNDTINNGFDVPPTYNEAIAMNKQDI